MKEDLNYLRHIDQSIERIERYTAEGRELFYSEPKTQDAVIRQLEIVGEAVKLLSQDLKDENPDIPWRQIAGLRDRLIHGYFAVNVELVWQVVDRDLPNLKEQLKLLATRMETAP